jgi:hypothetical protein
MSSAFKTPGVFIKEKSALPGSVAEVETAIPAFIGYTEKANRNGKSIINIPTRIRSFEEYLLLFGGAFSPKFKLEPKSTDPGNPDKHLIRINGEEKAISYRQNHELFMFRSIKLFFANGGGTGYIVSVGTYEGKDGVDIKKTALLSGLETLLKEQEPTIVVVPDAVKLNAEDCYEVYAEVLHHCAEMQSRVAIFDVQQGDGVRIEGTAEEGDVVAVFREKIGSKYLNYGAAYYPWLHTNMVQNDEISFENLDDSIKLEELLPEAPAKELIKNFRNTQSAKQGETPPGEKSAADKRNFHFGLLATSRTYVHLIKEIARVENLLPPSSAMAGIYTRVDHERGVWKAPANVSVAGVIAPSVTITNEDQEKLNSDAVSGKSINAIRDFPGLGTLVWGARTLDGNSLDWRYINVRRTVIMFEQSIKRALKAYVFEPNNANTWVNVKSMINNFLTAQWKRGALAGASPRDAFSVAIGLGSTMTATDILEGKMLVSVMLAIVRPAEFIVVTFEQQMQKV